MTSHVIVNNPEPILVTVNPPDEVEVVIVEPATVVEIVPGSTGARGISELNDVTLTEPIPDGAGLFYDMVTEKWVSEEVPEPLPPELSALEDVVITSPVDGSFLQYDDVTGKWVDVTVETPTMELASLLDVDLSGGMANGAMLTWDLAESKWVPSTTPDQGNYRGDWQNPADALLYSTDYSDITELDKYALSAEGTIGGTVSKSRIIMSATDGANKPAFTYAMLHNLTATSGTGVGAQVAALNLATLLPGKFISRVKVWLSSYKSTGTISQAPTIFHRVRLNGTTLTTINGSATQASPIVVDWAEYDISINATNGLLEFSAHENTSSASASNLRLNLAGLRLYGAVDASDLYHLGDVVSHAGNYWRSLYDNNNVEPSASAPQWLQIPTL